MAGDAEFAEVAGYEGAEGSAEDCAGHAERLLFRTEDRRQSCVVSS
jgi:hypothetical protein